MVLTNGVVGWRLLRTALRTRRVPELLIGLGLFGMGPVSQGLTAFAGTGRLPAGEVDLVLHVAASVGSAVGMSCIYAFVMTVFRPGVAWAKGLTALAALTLVATNASATRALAVAAPDVPSAAVIRESGALVIVIFTLAFGWAAFEAGSYWLRARKQLALGLTDRVVANRFLLWTIASGSAFLLGGCLLAFQLGGAPISGSLVPSLLIMAVSLVTATTMYLAFLPPRAYLTWLERRAGAAA